MEYNTARADESEEATRAASALRAELAAAKVREADLEAQVSAKAAAAEQECAKLRTQVSMVPHHRHVLD